MTDHAPETVEHGDEELVGFLYSVSAKVETLHMDGSIRYVFHGAMGMAGSESEPMNMAVHVPVSLWRTTEVGAVLEFGLTDIHPYNGATTP